MEPFASSQKAKYQVNKNTFVVCYLDVLEATSENFKAQVGIRAQGDSLIPLGTKLYMISDALYEQYVGKQRFDLFYVVVEDLEIRNGYPIQVCSAISKERRVNLRSKTRRRGSFPLYFSNEEGELGVLEGSVSGVSAIYHPQSSVAGLVVGQTYDLNFEYNTQLHSIQSRVAHLHYDWMSNEHVVGFAFENMSNEASTALSKLLDVHFIDTTPKSEVDADAARIKPQGI